MPLTDHDHQPGIGVRPQRQMQVPHPTILLGYAVAVLMGAVGIMILTGLLFAGNVPDRFRIMFGIVITLMGVYRFVLTRSRALQRMREERDGE